MNNNIESVTWEQTLEVASKSLDEIRLKLSEVVDRFTWETGSDEDLEQIKSLEFSLSLRKSIANFSIGNK